MLPPDLSSSMPLSQSSQTQSKLGLELGYSDISTTNNVSISSQEHYAPLYTQENTQFVMTEKHKLVHT
jgi:hypothetical protein